MHFHPHVNWQPRRGNGIASPKSRFTREEHAAEPYRRLPGGRVSVRERREGPSRSGAKAAQRL